MLIDVKCPRCRDVIPVSESAGEQKIDCPACGKNFAVPGSGKTSSNPPPSKDTDRGSKSRGRSRRDDRDDDDDDRPRRRDDESGAGGGMIGIMIFGGIGLIVLAIGFGITAWLIFSKDEPEVVKNAPNATKPTETRPNNAPSNPPPKSKPGKTTDDLPVRPGTKGTTPPKKEDDPFQPFTPDTPVKPEPPVRPDPPAKLDPAAPLAADEAPAVMLPAAADQIVVGAGGKRLFLHLKSKGQIAVFDPSEQKIVKYVSVADPDMVFTVGSDHLIIGYTRLRRIERISLATYEVEKAIDVPSKWPLRGLAMGGASNSMLFAATGDFPFGDELFLIDVAKMTRLNNSVVPNPGVHPDAALKMWASLDGRTFTATSGGLSRPTAYQIRLSSWLVSPSPCNPPLVSFDGDTIFGGSVIAASSGQPVGEKRGERGKGVWYLPAADGPIFLSLNERTFGQFPNEKKWPEVQVHLGRDQRPIVALPELPETKDFIDFFFAQTKPLDQHVFFLPSANALAILPVSRDRIHLRTIDIKAELAKTEIDYLAVASRPPFVKVGETFKYKPEIWSKKGGVKLKLDASPPGMKLDGETLTWTIPTKFPNGASVILSITDDGGKQIFHSFEVPIVFPTK